MRFQLGPVTAEQIQELGRATYSAPQTLSQTATGSVARVAIGQSRSFTAEEDTVTATAGLMSDTVTAIKAEFITHAGSRLLGFHASEFSITAYKPASLFPTSSIDALAFDLGTLWAQMATGARPSDALLAKYLAGNDTVIGNGEANWLVGGAGNDRLLGGGGADTIDGGAGSDTSVYAGARADHLLSRRSDGVVEVAARDGTTARNLGIETLEFSDGSVNAAAIAYLPGYSPLPSGAVQPVFRFYNARDKAFFYTNSAAERDMIIRESTDPGFGAPGLWPYFYQGATFEQAHGAAAQVPVHRFYNTSTGHHFFTTSAAEKDLVLRESTDPTFGQPGLWPFIYEGVGFTAYDRAAHRDAVPVYRFYSPAQDRHFFTASADEAAQIRLTGQWSDEGVGFWGELLG